jgi:hypothetical protein
MRQGAALHRDDPTFRSYLQYTARNLRNRPAASTQVGILFMTCVHQNLRNRLNELACVPRIIFRNRPAATLVYSADGSSTGAGAEMSSRSKVYLTSERLVEGAAIGVGREAEGAGDGCGGWPCRGRHAGRALQRSVVRLR